MDHHRCEPDDAECFSQQHGLLRGRHEVLRGIWNVVHKVTSGHSRTLWIEGPVGTGKTKLLQRTLSAATTHGFTVAPMVRVPDRLTSPVASMLDRPTQESDNDWPNQLLDELGDKSSRAGRYSQLALGIDDAHRLRPSVVESLLSVSSLSRHRPVLVVLTWRSCGISSGLDALLVSDDRALVRVNLEPLDEQAVTEIAVDLLDGVPQRNLLNLCAAAGGNPYFLTQLLHGLRDERRLVYHEGTVEVCSDEVPRRVQTIVQQRMGRLSGRSRQVVRVAAALGQSFTPVDVADMLQETTASLLAAIEEAIAVGVLDFWQDDLRFQNSLIQRTVLELLPCSVQTALRHEASQLLAERLAPGSSAPGMSVLSATEHRIAELVADGLTNRQIAKHVHLSQHTVNYHLRRMFRRLQISSRVELARLVHEPS